MLKQALGLVKTKRHGRVQTWQITDGRCGRLSGGTPSQTLIRTAQSLMMHPGPGRFAARIDPVQGRSPFGSSRFWSVVLTVGLPATAFNEKARLEFQPQPCGNGAVVSRPLVHQAVMHVRGRDQGPAGLTKDLGRTATVQMQRLCAALILH